MKICIIHLTDIHINEIDFVQSKVNSLCKSIEHEIIDTENIFIVISGDIAFSGKKGEYKQAEIFLKSIIDKILSIKSVNIVIVPGNHDCDYEKDNQLRKGILSTINEDVLKKDDSILDCCLSVQSEYWKFCEKLGIHTKNKLYYPLIFNVGEYKIQFHCFNTSWMSTLGQRPGGIYFPTGFVNYNLEDIDLNISVYHHPVNWITPETDPNNKKEFEKLLSVISTIQLVGHEHESSFDERKNHDIECESLTFSGMIFHDKEKGEVSGYQIIKLNILEKKGNIVRFEYNKNIYLESYNKNFDYECVKKRKFNLKENFLNDIKLVSLPLHENKSNIDLEDIFVFPHVEKIEIDQRYIDSYVDSSSILDMELGRYIFLEGDSQIGKTSLLKKLCIDSYKNNLYPIFLNAKKITNNNYDTIIPLTFRQNYIEKGQFSQFKQIENDQKILILDDFHRISATSDIAQKFIEDACSYFGRIIISIDSIYGSFPNLHKKYEKFTFYNIKPFGHKKTNDLIIRHYSLAINPATIEKQLFLNQVRDKYDQVRIIIGNKIIPSYPIFLLSILQSLNNSSIDLSETSYGYCYQSLIHYALSIKSGVDNDSIGSYMNFIKIIAYYFYRQDMDSITEEKFLKFYNEYINDYAFFPFDIVKNNLLKSQIIIREDGEYRFGYKYILYFLAAKHISDIINTEDGKSIIKKLFDNIHREDCSNILVFITHHTNDVSFIHDAMFHSMVPFESVDPISLMIDDPFYDHLVEISKDISGELIENKNTPEEERDKNLVDQDKAEREIELINNDNGSSDEVSEAARPFLHAFRSIDIVGQIVKNRKGSLKKDNIEDLISEIYETGFRTIGFLGELFDDTRDTLIDEMSKTIKSTSSSRDIEDNVRKFIQVMSFQVCLGVFTKLIYSVGIKDFNTIYENVAKKIGTPAAKLVSYSINSYYNEMSLSDTIALAKEFKNNIVATSILRSRVRAYLYTNHVNYKKKQQLAQAVGLTVSPVRPGKIADAYIDRI